MTFKTQWTILMISTTTVKRLYCLVLHVLMPQTRSPFISLGLHSSTISWQLLSTLPCLFRCNSNILFTSDNSEIAWKAWRSRRVHSLERLHHDQFDPHRQQDSWAVRSRTINVGRWCHGETDEESGRNETGRRSLACTEDNFRGAK